MYIITWYIITTVSSAHPQKEQVRMKSARIKLTVHPSLVSSTTLQQYPLAYIYTRSHTIIVLTITTALYAGSVYHSYTNIV